MTNFIFTLLLTTLSFNVYSQCKFINKLDIFQENIAYQTYRIAQPYDLGLTAVAIAWEESKLGKYKFRYGKGVDKSVGVMHTAIHYKTKHMTAFEAGRWAERMVVNDAYSIQVGVSDILYWQERSDNWKDGVGKYNGGNKPNYKYAYRVIETVNQLKNCEW